VTILTIPAVILSAIAIMYLLYIFATLSRKLGAVTKMRPLYRWLYVAMALVAMSFISRWMVLTPFTLPEAVPALMLSDWFDMLGSTVPLMVAAVLALTIVLRYWGWLFREHDR
jgi:hypothetical protein